MKNYIDMVSEIIGNKKKTYNFKRFNVVRIKPEAKEIMIKNKEHPFFPDWDYAMEGTLGKLGIVCDIPTKSGHTVYLVYFDMFKNCFAYNGEALEKVSEGTPIKISKGKYYINSRNNIFKSIMNLNEVDIPSGEPWICSSLTGEIIQFDDSGTSREYFGLICEVDKNGVPTKVDLESSHH